ncbi:unnamed protein product [Owenia fusiformis]|uniref:Uncharacterized protein n=1 Tax=Owenia fusiformis TaxID=6347 RepID=A0A8J1TPH4_OWEFU|nr:unnamed protein product [Owenia fusiformis]
MSKFHEKIRNVLQDVEKFLIISLKSEHLCKPNIEERDSIVEAIGVIRDEFPQLHLEHVVDPNPSKKPIVTSSGTQLFDAGDYVYTDTSAVSPSGVDGKIPPNTDEVYDECQSLSDKSLSSNAQSKSSTTIDRIDEESVASDEYGDMVPGSNVVSAEIATMGAIKTGWLDKRRKKDVNKLIARLQPYQKRWCVLKDTTFYYFTSASDLKQCGHFSIAGYEARAGGGKRDNSFGLVKPGERTYQFVAHSKDELNDWLESFSKSSGIPSLPHSPSRDKLSVSDDEESTNTDDQTINKKVMVSPIPPANITPEPVEAGDDIYEDTDNPSPFNTDDFYADTEAPPLPSANEVDKVDNKVEIIVTEDVYDDTDEVSVPTEDATADDIYEECSSMPTVKAPPVPSPDLIPTDSLERGVEPPHSSTPITPDAYLKPLPSFRLPGQKGIMGDIDFENVYMGLWDCKADGKDELEFKRGDLIYIMNKDYDDYSWWVGQLSCGKFGLVPADFLMQAYEEIP